ncbi:hypothetical protein EBX93_16330, partial [bacterium]|nr:hypothetical protein [bacterium]
QIIYNKNSSTWTIVPSGKLPPNFSGTFNAVYVYDLSNAIIVGSGGKILYSTDAYETWKYIPYDVIDDAGTAFIINKSNLNFNDIQMSDNNTFVITAVLQTFSTSPTIKLGSSKVFYIHAPELFNSTNNTVLDICGNMRISGDILSRRNIYADNVLSIRGNIESTSKTSGTLLVKGGAGIDGNINVSGNVNVSNVIYSNTYYSNGGNISIGTEDLSLYTRRMIYIGDTNNLNQNTPAKQIITIGGRNDVIIINGALITNGTNSFNTPSTGGGAASTVDSMAVTNNMSVGSRLTINGDQESVDLNSGSFITNGGITVKKSAIIAGNIEINGTAVITNTTSSTSSTTGAFRVSGGVGIGENIHVAGYGRIDSLTTSTDSLSGAFVVKGGVGIQGRLNVGSRVEITDLTASTNSSTGSLVTSGGVGIGGNVYVNGVSRVLSSIDSASVASGALVVTGGVGIGGNVNMTGNLKISSTLTSSTTSN